VVDSASVLVKPATARKQLAEGTPVPEPGLEKGAGVTGGEEPGREPEPLVVDGKPHRFYAVVVVDPVRMSRDAGQVADEVVKHLAGLTDTNVEVRIEITAASEDGFEDYVVRTVTENAKTLKFDQHGFEEF
jgi:hypothetical protein